MEKFLKIGRPAFGGLLLAFVTANMAIIQSGFGLLAASVMLLVGIALCRLAEIWFSVSQYIIVVLFALVAFNIFAIIGFPYGIYVLGGILIYFAASKIVPGRLDFNLPAAAAIVFFLLGALIFG